jgi:hypothetical protein
MDWFGMDIAKIALFSFLSIVAVVHVKVVLVIILTYHRAQPGNFALLPLASLQERCTCVVSYFSK